MTIPAMVKAENPDLSGQDAEFSLHLLSTEVLYEIVGTIGGPHNLQTVITMS